MYLSPGNLFLKNGTNPGTSDQVIESEIFACSC